jgi:AraC-like DNA-binding protein
VRSDIRLCIVREDVPKTARLCLEAPEPVLILRFGIPRISLPSGMCRAYAPGSHVLAGPPVRGVAVGITQSRLRSILAEDVQSLPAPVHAALSSEKHAPSIALTPEQVLAAIALMHCPYAGAVRNIFIKSKTLELIALFFLQMAWPGGMEALSPGDRAFVTAAREYFLVHLEQAPTVRQLACHAGTNEARLQRLFKRAYGVSACVHLRRERMTVARRMLLEQGVNVTEAAFAVGYSNVSHFIDAFTKQYGIRPGEVRARRV